MIGTLIKNQTKKLNNKIYENHKCVDLNWHERAATIVGFVCLYIKIKIARQNMLEEILDYRKCCKESRTSYCNKPYKTKKDCHIIVHTIVTFEARKYKKVIVSVKDIFL